MTTGISKDMTEVTGVSVVEASFKCNASCIIVLTRTGKSAHMIAKYRPRCPIFAVTRFEQVNFTVESAFLEKMSRMGK